MLKFLLEDGAWKGKGSVTLPMGAAKIQFTTSWRGAGHLWIQEVMLEGSLVPVINAYRIRMETPPQIDLESPHLGKHDGNFASRK